MLPSINGSIAKNRVLVVGATGFIGQFISHASLDSGGSTYILIRSLPRCPAEAKAVKAFEDKGAIVVHGSINDQEFMEKILREHGIDIVISAVGGANIMDQIALVHALKTVGTIKRFLPSEFGHDVNRADPVEPGLTMYKEKRTVRRLIEEKGIPYTYICCNSIVSWPYHDNKHPSQVLPPLDQFRIYGDGNVKGLIQSNPSSLCTKEKRTMRRLIEEKVIPNTYICCNPIASWPYRGNKHPSEILPPLDRFRIYDDDNVKGSRP